MLTCRRVWARAELEKARLSHFSATFASRFPRAARTVRQRVTPTLQSWSPMPIKPLRCMRPAPLRVISMCPVAWHRLRWCAKSSAWSSSVTRSTRSVGVLNHTYAPSRGHALAPFPRVVVSCRVRLGMVPCWIVGHASQDLCLWGHKHVPMALACAAVGYNKVR